MRKSKFFLFLFVICILALVLTGLFACNKKPIEDATEEDEERVMPVSTAVELVHTALLAADQAGKETLFSLQFDGSYESGEDTYDFSFDGLFDLSAENQKDDIASRLSFTLKQGEKSLLQVYYTDGDLYLEYQPYAHLAQIRDFNLAERAYEINEQKGEAGLIKAIVDSLPDFAKTVFDDCTYTSENGEDCYTFTLSVKRLFDNLPALVASWNAGITPTEFSAVFNLTDERIKALSEETAKTTVECRLKDGVLTSASATTEGKGAFRLKSFLLATDVDAPDLPKDDLASFTEFDLRNLSLSGRLNLSTSYLEGGDRSGNYGILINRKLQEVTYPFDYTLRTRYTDGGLEGDLTLTEVGAEGGSGKTAAFAIRENYLYVDLSAYGIEKFKVKTDSVLDGLRTAGFRDTDEYDFYDKLRLLTLLRAGRTEDGDTVTYHLTTEILSLLSQKFGFLGILGVEEGQISWSTANNRLQNPTLTLRSGALTASLSVNQKDFSFGSPATLRDIEDERLYVDLSSRENTLLTLSGYVSKPSFCANPGGYLSAVLSSLSGETLTFTSTGAVRYDARVLYGKSGSLQTAILSFYDSNNGNELANLYYADATSSCFYLIYPEIAGQRAVRTLPIRDLSALNTMIGTPIVNPIQRIYLETDTDSTHFGVHSGMLSWIEEKLQLFCPDFSFRYLTELNCVNYELEMKGFGTQENDLTAWIAFDANAATYLQIKISTLAVSFNEVLGNPTFELNTPETVSLLDDNSMPTRVKVIFQGGISFDNLSLENPWIYEENRPKALTGSTVTQTAKFSLLGVDYSCNIRVDCSYASAVTGMNSARFSDHAIYDREEEVAGFRFDRYGNDSLEEVIRSFDQLTVTVRGVSYYKEIDWDFTNQSIDVLAVIGIKPRVYSFFGDPIYIKDEGGAEKVFPLVIDGAKAVAIAEDPEIVFTPYEYPMDKDTIPDPFDEASYPEKISILLSDGTVLHDFSNFEWDLSWIRTTTQRTYINENGNRLYTYEGISKVSIRIKDFIGRTSGDEVFDVDVHFRARVVTRETITFGSMPNGITYDAENGAFNIDPLIIQSITHANKLSILPTSFVVNAGAENEFRISGVDWDFTPFDRLNNATGVPHFIEGNNPSRTFTLRFGDDVSGYQEISFTYACLPRVITETRLLDDDKNILWSKTTDVFHYNIGENDPSFSAFSYAKPAFVQVFYDGGEAILPVSWTFDKPYDESELTLTGDTYVATARVGSETLTLTLHFHESRIIAPVGAQTLTSRNGKLIPTQSIDNGTTLVLCYSALDSWAEDGLHYWDKDSYPTSLQLVCSNTDHPVTALEVDWDLSALLSQANVLENGYRGEVIAVIKGQRVAVQIHVTPVTGFYIDQDKNPEKVVHVLSVESYDVLKNIDPTDAATYGDSVYLEGTVFDVNGDETTEIREIKISLPWDTKEVAELLKDKESVYEVEGSASIKTRISYGAANGYAVAKDLSFTVSLRKSNYETVEPKGIPYAASSHQTGGNDLKAISVAGAGTVGKEGTKDFFAYDFALIFNPYYIDCASVESYPTHILAKINGEPCRFKIDRWDLSAITKDEPISQADATYTAYKVYAEISFDKEGTITKKIPVEVRKLACNIIEIWYGDSKEHQIDIDCYEANPFGTNVEGNIVTLDVEVRFDGLNGYYPLMLKYDKSTIVLNHNGATYDLPVVFVGNESYGYRTYGDYTVNVKQKTVQKIVMNTYGDREYVLLYEKTWDKNTNRVDYTYIEEVLIENQLPNRLLVTFEGAAEPIDVMTASEGATGILFKWDGTTSVILWNPTLLPDDFDTESDLVQKIEIVTQQARQLEAEDDSKIFPNDDRWITMTYRDGEDEGGRIRSTELFNTYREIVERYTAISSSRWTATLCEKGEDGAYLPVSANMINAGDYYLQITMIEDDTAYVGSTVKKITVLPKDVSAYVVFYVDSDDTPYNPRTKYTYVSGSPYEIYAKISNNSNIVLLIKENGAAGAPLDRWTIDGVKYQENSATVIPYDLVLCTDESDSFSKNYVVRANLAFKVEEASVRNEDFVWSVTWISYHQRFEVSVSINGVALSPQEASRPNDLTNGYLIRYYEGEYSSDDKVLVTDGVFTPGKTYSYMIYAKIGNYELKDDHGQKTV